jgi:methionyl-tRNA synthetase
MQYYDEEAKTFLADRYITGECPHCHAEGAYGDQCEKCGTSLSPTDLINPKSAISGSQPVMRETKHWYLPLDKHEEWLRQWILEDHKEWRPNVYGQCKSWLDMGLQPRAVSRDLDWGIPVPVEGAEGKVLYVWFDAPIGYISNTKELLPDSWEKWWKDPETRLVHFIGKDNIVFHCIVFPAMLKAEGSYILPDNVPSNEFLNLEGDKISTSRNWAVWLHEYLEDFPGKQDVLRYVLTANAPETKDNDFTWKDFQARNNNELVAVYGNFVNRALQLTKKYFDGVVPAAGELNDYDRETLKEFADVKEEVEKLLDVFKFRDAQKEAMNLARIGNKYLADTEPWKLAKTDMPRVATILNISLQLVANLAIAFEPFLPFSSEKLRKMLNMDSFDWAELGHTDLLPAGHQLATPELLFEKIEDDVIQAQVGADFELIARGFVDVRGTQHVITLDLGRQRHRTLDHSASALGGVDDFLGGTVDQVVVKRLQTDADFLALHVQSSPAYLMILATTPAPTVRPPSRMAKRRPSSMAIGAIRATLNSTLSPGITISTPSFSEMAPGSRIADGSCCGR